MAVEQEFYVFMQEDDVWWHGSCWEREREHRRGVSPPNFAASADLDEALSDEYPDDYAVFDPEDREDFDGLGELAITIVPPADFGAVRRGVTDPGLLEEFRCHHCKKVIAEPSL